MGLGKIMGVILFVYISTVLARAAGLAGREVLGDTMYATRHATLSCTSSCHPTTTTITTSA
jgi:hypothetical protein